MSFPPAKILLVGGYPNLHDVWIRGCSYPLGDTVEYCHRDSTSDHYGACAPAVPPFLLGLICWFWQDFGVFFRVELTLATGNSLIAMVVVCTTIAYPIHRFSIRQEPWSNSFASAFINFSELLETIVEPNVAIVFYIF